MVIDCLIGAGGLVRPIRWKTSGFGEPSYFIDLECSYSRDLCFWVIRSALLIAVALAYPQFPEYYKANVTVTLPYADFVEPIFVYYDGPSKKARFDYCNGDGPGSVLDGGVNRFFYDMNKEVGYAIVGIWVFVDRRFPWLRLRRASTSTRMRLL